MSEVEKLRQQLAELSAELEKQKLTNEVLKKRALQAILGSGGSARCEEDRKACEVGRAQAEQASQVKSLFLENVSHEIRSAIYGIMGMTGLLQETEVTSQQQGYLEMVGSSVDRLMAVVNEVLDFSSIEAGDLELESEDFNLRESLDHDLYVLSLGAEKKDLTLSCTIGSSVPAHVHGDSARLVQIISNLVNNSVKFSSQGEIVVGIENHGYDHHNKLRLRFEVSDQGCGISGDKLQQIQGYFTQNLESGYRLPLAVGSAGLGLTVASQLVRLMEGEIGVDSDDSGATFWFVLPFTEVADSATVEEKASQALENIEEDPGYVLRGARVLLVEDEYINRLVIETVLRKLGVDVTSVDNGEEAVTLGCSGDFQLVLMDLQLEGLDGLSATRAIRSFEKKNGGHLPIIALTAVAVGGVREKCLQAGMDGYLAKPLHQKELVATLTEFLTSKALLVDSDPESQALLVRTLVESGWRVTIAESKRSALYEASLCHFELILFDISSPQLDGCEAIKVIRQLEQYSAQRAKIIGIGELQVPGIDWLLQRPVTRESIEPQIVPLNR